jgi:hypothetical protein
MQAERNPAGNLKGEISESGTKTPLAGVNIFIKNSNIGTSSNESGAYLIDGLPVGTYHVVYSYIGFEKVIKTDVIIRSNRTTFLNIEMTASNIEMDNVIIESGYFSEVEDKPVSTINFSSEEIRRAPGSAGDVSRIIYGLPSLAKINDQRNSLIVRGGSPIENSFYLDNIEIPNINHFAVQGSSDGPIGLLNVDFINDVNFYSGGFSPVYGDKLSSIMEITFREGNKDNFEPQIQLSLAGFGGAVEGPIGEKGSYLISASRSYLDLIISAAETGGAIPRYGNAQGKFVYNINEKNKISLINILSLDEINLKYENAVSGEVTNLYGETNGLTNTAGLNWDFIWKNSGFSKTSLSHNFTSFDRDYYQTKNKEHLFKNNSKENRIKFRNTNFFKLDKSNSYEFGAETTVFLNTFDFIYEECIDNFGNVTPKTVIDKKLNTFSASIFGIHKLLITEKLELNYGIRLDYFDFNNSLNAAPRITLSYKIDEITKLSASAGIFYQNIPTNLLVQNNIFGNLKTPTSNHFILGLNRMINETTKLTIEVYYKTYLNFPIDTAQPKVFLFDEAVSNGIFLNHENLVDAGKAFSTGLEIMIQKKLAADFYGLVSGSISKSRYRDLNGNWYNRIYDNQFNFTFEGGYIPNDEWEIKLRWIYAGGAPYTPFNIEESISQRRGIWDTEKINSERFTDYHSLNIRVDKRFYFESSNLVLYLSVWNAYGRRNIAQYVWNEIKNEIDKLKQWNTLPVLGLEYEF